MALLVVKLVVKDAIKLAAKLMRAEAWRCVVVQVALLVAYSRSES